MFDNQDINGKQGVYYTFPILKVNKTARELCKTDQPQWIVIRWTMGMPNAAFNLHLHESILNNFNFEYVYNYFFNPEKVKGQFYKPLRSPTIKEAVAVTEASELKNTAICLMHCHLIATETQRRQMHTLSAILKLQRIKSRGKIMILFMLSVYRRGDLCFLAVNVFGCYPINSPKPRCRQYLRRDAMHCVSTNSRSKPTCKTNLLEPWYEHYLQTLQGLQPIVRPHPYLLC